MVPPLPPPQLLLLAALAGLLGPGEVVAEPAEEGARCPEGLWPLPPKVLPRVTYTQVRPVQAERVAFFYHPCAHSWLKLQLFLLAHVCVTKPTLIPDSSLTQDRPLMLTSWGTSLEMAWVEPTWAAQWLRRRRQRWKQRKKVMLYSNTVPGPSPLMSRESLRGCVQAPTLAFAVWNWWPPGTEVKSRGHRPPLLSGTKRRRLRAALGLQPTPSGRRVPSASPWSLKAQQPTVGTLGEGGSPSSVTPVSLLPGSNASSRTDTQIHNGPGSPGGCVCPSQASSAPRAAAPRAPRGPTPRTEEAAWAAMALTFLLVLLTLATLCTRLHRNFRRSESIYWGPTTDSQDTVAAVLKRRLLLPSRRVKRSRRRPLLPPSSDSGPESESSD